MQNISHSHFVKIEGYCGENLVANKVEKFSCKALKNSGSNSVIRIIFVAQKCNEVVKISFIEIYYKGNDENQDYTRLKEFIEKLK